MEENNYSSRIIKEKFKTKKLKPRIDLAAMVSVSFLLIVFFMVNRELSKPQAIDLGMPNGGGCHFGGCYKPDEKRVITLLLDDNNKIIFYWGLLDVPNEKIKKLNYGKNGIRKELAAKNKIIKKYLHGRGINDRGAIVLIKPSKKCNYGNLVDILDEMAITKIETYAIINDFTNEESKLLASN